MKEMEICPSRKPSLCPSLPFALALLALVVTGCPRKEYIVQLQPQGPVLERTLVFYCADGANSNGVPNYDRFDTNELTAIAALYPAQGPALNLTNGDGRHQVRGEFTNALPADVGGAGAYTRLATSLGAAGFYEERFRGNDDLAGIAAQRAQAADQLADLLLGWSRRELGREPGYRKLRQFLDVDFRRDLKNLGAYRWEAQVVGNYITNADEEFMVRFGQYLCERGYFQVEELPGLFRDMNGGDSSALWRRIQRLVARKMGASGSGPVPAALGFLADETSLETSLNKYLAGTDLYHAKLRAWQADKKRKPDTKPPEPSEVMADAAGALLAFHMFGGTPEHLTVRLSLPAAPVHSNGRWDEALKQVVWDADLGDRTNATLLPVACYASWVQPDEAFQQAHLGKVVLTGDELTEYCLWRGSLTAASGDAWDAFLAGLQPGAGLTNRLAAFRFPGEAEPPATNGPARMPGLSAYPRELLNRALE
jgi:hypothetical protein